MSDNQKRYLPILILVFFVVVIWFLNFKPAYWLTGWDNLHPEFDFNLNIKRSIFAVWQEYQGLGLLGGMGHASDLPRQFFLAFFSLLLPVHWLRSFYVFLMLLIGPIGVYFLLEHLFSINSTSEESLRNSSEVSLASFLGALFYLLNLTTVQFFYVPFETFIVHYGFLPWLIFLVFKFLKNGSKKTLLLFFLVSFLSTTQFYVPTLFVVYFLALFLICFGIFIREKTSNIFKKSFLIFLITFLANSFWLLPFLYFSLTSASVVGDAWENFMATENVFLRNKEFGRIGDVAILRGFWFKFTDFTQEGKLDYMVKVWREHLNSWVILSLGYLQFAIILIGIISQIIKKEKYFLSLFLIFLFSFVMLANDVSVISIIVQFLQSKVPLFGQVFRVPFTKFGVIAVFVYSIFFGIGFSFLVSKINSKNKLLSKIFFLIVTSVVVIFIWPIFQGGLIYQHNKLKIPNEYFDIFGYFKDKPLGRIANFPQHSFWGWNYYNWGYVGSGFLWYGIRQPILDRAFDGYSQFNENYYHEISYALYSKNLPLFEKILEKYQINWLLVDGNVVSYTSPKSLYLEELEELISGSPKISLAAQFGKIKIYQVNLESKPNNFIFLVQNLPKVEPAYKWNNFDKGYEECVGYITESQKSKVESQSRDGIFYYPFRSLFAGRRQEELEFGIEDKNEYFVFKAKIPKELAGSKLILPKIDEEEITEINEKDLSKRKTLLPKVYLDGELVSSGSSPPGESVSATPGVSLSLTYIKEGNFEVWVPKIKGFLSYDSQEDEEFFQKKAQSCDAFNKGEFKLEKLKENEEEFLRFEAKDQASCLDIWLPNLENRIGYLVSLQARFQQGKSLLFWLENLQSRKADIETYLPKRQKFEKYYFIQPPMAKDGLGYSLHFNNISIGRVRSVNDLARVTVNPIPYKFLTGIKIINGQPSVACYQSSDIKVSHSNEGFYKIEITNTQYLTPNTYLVLSQSFSKDWLAFQFKIENLKLKINFFPHVLVNNWENGWQIGNHPLATSRQSPITIYLFFWPQLLEYLGFGLLLVCFLVISRYGSEALQYPHQKS